ncbi:hypothetical protein JCM1841_005878 [Sporobolomyces salmonicolor]
METPYPSQLPLSASSTSSTAAPSSTNPSSGVNAATTSTSNEPRQSRKRSLTDQGEKELGVDTPERAVSREADYEGDAEEEGDHLTARPRVLGRSRQGSAGGDLARRMADRTRRASVEGDREQVWMARTRSAGGTVCAGPGTDPQRESKRRRVTEEDDETSSGAVSGPRLARRARPTPLIVVPSFRDEVKSLASLRSCLIPSTQHPLSHAAQLRPPATPSTPSLPIASPLAPAPSPFASSARSPFAHPFSPDARSATAVFSSPLSPAPLTPTLRRRAHSLPALSRPSHLSMHPFRQAAASPSPRASPYHPSPLHTSHSRTSRKHKFYDSGEPPRRRRHAAPVADPFFSAGAEGRPSTSLDPRLVVARLEHMGGSLPLSQGELVAVHAVRFMSDGEEPPVPPLVPTSLVPPITKATLHELDLHEVMRNAQLRHDVVFDPNLMFRPNYDGERGERKRVAAEQYWTTVSREISLGCRCTTFSGATALPCICLPPNSTLCATPPPTSLSSRLPSRIAPLIVELRNILLSLLPAPPSPPVTPPILSTPTFGQSSGYPYPSPNSPTSPLASPGHPSASFAASRDQIFDVLDPAFLSQQLARGVLNLASLARFLGMTLKTHCAPMRDELVDEMVAACEGEGFVKGLRMCFEILELMKLDIANHQLRSLRPYLIQTALEFERRFFQDFAARRRGRLSFERSRAWLNASVSTVDVNNKPRTGATRDLVDKVVSQGMLDLIFSSSPSAASANEASPPPSSPVSLASLPETVQLDSYRLQAFHTDATDLTVVYCLTLLYQQLAFPARPTPAEVDSVRKELWCIMAATTGVASSLVGPAASNVGIPQGPPGQGAAKLETEAWRSAMKDVLLQVAARAKETKDGAAGGAGRAAPSMSSSTLPPVPDQKTVELVSSYFDSNVKADSKLFRLLQSRLRETVQAVVEEELAKERERGGLGFIHWWTPTTSVAPMMTGSRRGAWATRSTPCAPDASMMASSSPIKKRGVKRSHAQGQEGSDTEASVSSSEDEGDKRQRTGRSSSISTRTGLTTPSFTSAASPSAVDLALSRNGLTALAGEVRVLGERIAKVTSFNLSVYRPLYETLLSSPSSTRA